MSNQSSQSLSRLILVVFAVLVLLPLAMMAFAVPMMGGVYYGMHGTTGTTGGWFAGFGLLWLAVVVGGGYVIYRAVTRRGGDRNDAALEELRVAYARGDLSHEEYEERRERLERD